MLRLWVSVLDLRLGRLWGCLVLGIDYSRLLRLFARTDLALGDRAAVAEAIELVAGLHDVAVMGQSIQQHGGELGVDEDMGSFGEGEVGGDDDAGVFVAFAQ